MCDQLFPISKTEEVISATLFIAYCTKNIKHKQITTYEFG